MYQKNVKSPIPSASKFDFHKSIELPRIKKLNEIKRTLKEETSPEGIGLFLVLSIRRSVLLSWKWFSAAAPQASKNIPRIGYNENESRLCEARIYPSAVVKATRTVILTFATSKIILNHFEIPETAISEFRYFFDSRIKSSVFCDAVRRS